MTDTVRVTAMVIGTMPLEEYDKRLLLLTREAGKLSCFARGARRTSSPLIGASTLFSFGNFELLEGRSSYTLKSASVTEHFDFLTGDMEAMCYASYFAELADYYCRENVESGGPLLLLYLALKSLERGILPKKLVQSIYELKLMQLEGEYFPEPRRTVSGKAALEWKFVLEAPPEKWFSLPLQEPELTDFRKAVEDQKSYFIDREFRSLKVLGDMFP